MNRFFHQKSVLFILLSILISQNVFAITCAEVYEKNLNKVYLKSGAKGAAEVLTVAAVPVTIFVFLGPFLPFVIEYRKHSEFGTTSWTDPQNRKRVIQLLEAASILKKMEEDKEHKEQDEDLEKIKWADKKIKSFYNKYISAPYPHSDITLDVVIDSLAHLNDRGVKYKLCHHLKSKKALANLFFENGKSSIAYPKKVTFSEEVNGERTVLTVIDE